jgi:apolipoprotein N-acyltransferase
VQIWPGAAPTIALTNDPDRRTAVVATIPKGGVLLAGSMHLPDETGADRLARGSLLGISDAGEVLAAYDGKCPAPFGQYEQLRSLLSFRGLAEGRRGLVPGLATVSVPGVPPFRPLICPEAIVPGLTAPANGAQPLWLLDIANDAQFGRSSGRYQHFQMARVRAVEQGLPLVHAANTGISAVVDPLGRITAQLRLDETGVLDAALPAALSAATLYGRFGERLVLTIAVIVAAASIVARRLGRTTRKFGRR